MKYKIILFNSFGDDKVEHFNSYLFYKLRLSWLSLIGKDAVWIKREES